MKEFRSLVKPVLRQGAIEVRRSPIHRWGIFATEDIEKDELLEESPYILTPVEEFENSPTLERYSYGLDDCNSVVGLGYAGLYNHSFEPNAAYYIDSVNDVMIHYALQPIKIGEEITIDYGIESIEDL